MRCRSFPWCADGYVIDNSTSELTASERRFGHLDRLVRVVRHGAREAAWRGDQRTLWD